MMCKTHKWDNKSYFKCIIPDLFFIYFNFLKTNIAFLQQTNVENKCPVYGAGIRTHVLQNLSHLR